MRKTCVFLSVCALAAVLLTSCGDENLAPYFTRLDVSAECGVAPFDVEFYAIATGGNEFSDPTGANLYLEINWNFDDGHQTSGSSIVYHTFTRPDTYQVTVTVKDEDGDRASRVVPIVVLEDTLHVWAESEPAGTANVGEEVQFEAYAEACGFDPDPATGDYSRFQIRWFLDDAASTVKRIRDPKHVFTAADVGRRRAIVRFFDPAQSIARRDTLFIDVIAP
jgi:hypothetical protein